jgi:superfamily II DNA/RNA helicase
VCSLECRDVCTSRRQQLKRSDELRRKLGIHMSAISATPSPWPTPLVDFQQGACLPKELLENLSANGFERPTAVQMQTIPCVLQRQHVRYPLTSAGWLCVSSRD